MIRDLFGDSDADDDRTTKARDFISRYEQGSIDQGYSDEEAYQNFHRVSQRIDPDTMQRAAEQAFARMDPNQRAQVAQFLQQRSGYQMSGGAPDDPRQMAGMVSQIQRDQPGGLESLFGAVGGGGGGSGSGGGGISEAIGNLFGGGGTQQQGQQPGDEGGGFPGGTLGKIALGGIAAFAMKELLSGKDDEDKPRRRTV
jgi:hypothetical protein